MDSICGALPRRCSQAPLLYFIIISCTRFLVVLDADRVSIACLFIIRQNGCWCVRAAVGLRAMLRLCAIDGCWCVRTLQQYWDGFDIDQFVFSNCCKHKSGLSKHQFVGYGKFIDCPPPPRKFAQQSNHPLRISDNQSTKKPTAACAREQEQLAAVSYLSCHWPKKQKHWRYNFAQVSKYCSASAKTFSNSESAEKQINLTV